ncbi:MAG: hypothetical protein JWM68_1330 [Verrucomicrobiales bacterium]|nr:hypothetical protein [Verrucomicrobiales bacterium]
MKTILSIFVATLCAATSHAATLYWSGTPPTEGGAGTWNTTAAHFGDTNTGPFTRKWTNANLDSVVFEGTAGAVAMSATNTVETVIIPVSGYSFSGGAGTLLNFSGTNAGIDATYTSGTTSLNGIYGGSVLTKTGAGQVTLNNSSHTVSKFVVKGGFFAIAAANRLGTTPPATLVPDFLTLDGGGLGTSIASADLGATRGIVLGAGNGFFGASSGANVIIVSGPISGPGGLRATTGAPMYSSYNAGCVLQLDNPANNYAGTTTITGSTIKMGASEVIPNGSGLTGSGTLDLNGFNETIAYLTMSGPVKVSTGTLTLNATATNARSYTGVLSGTGKLVKSGSNNIQTLGGSGASTFSGKFVLNGGRIGIANDARLGTAPASAETNNITFGGGGLVTTAGFELNANRGMTLTGNGTWEHTDAAVEATYAGIIGGSGTFTKSGVGTLVLNGLNTYTNSTIVSAGTLKLGNQNAIQFSSTYAINGATSILDLNTFNPGVKGLSGTGTILSSGGAVSIGITNGNLAAGTSLTANAVGLLTVAANLTLIDSTNRWELGALYDDVDGTNGVNFDQIQVTTGELALTNSVLSIDFTGTGVAPDFATPFWQSTHTWTVMKMVAPGANTALNNFVSVKTNAYIYAGTFATSVNAGTGNILLNYTPNGPTGPIILAQPQDKNVVESNNVNLTVSATGTATLNYQWYFGATPIATGTTATLTITNAQTADGGSYHVVIDNGIDTMTSSNATLTILYLPVLTTAPQSQTAIAGTPVSFTVAASGTSPFTYQWKKNGSNISTATNTIYSISTVTTNDAATYTVAVTNSAGGVVSTNAVLTVIVPPTLTTQPVSQKVNLGSSVTFTVAASGTAPFTYQWKKDGSNISTATNTSYAILSVTTNDLGNYSVGVTNSAGGVISTNAALTLIAAASPKLSLTVTNNSAVLSWSSEAGRVYRPQLNLDLNNTNWTSIPPDITADGTNSVITNSTSATTNQFYRVLALPSP